MQDYASTNKHTKQRSGVSGGGHAIKSGSRAFLPNNQQSNPLSNVQRKQIRTALSSGQGASAPAATTTTKPAESLPNTLRNGLEGLSGIDLTSLRVHRESPNPILYNALAYTRGTDIYLGPGQSQHLPHEAWHAVQQLQGRVAPLRTMPSTPAASALNLSTKGQAVTLNDDISLEKEADVMGEKARHHRGGSPETLLQAKRFGDEQAPVQRRLIATGSDVDAFIDLAEPASGLDLEHDSASNEINDVASLLVGASSASFSSILTNVMGDITQDAEVNFGRQQAGVGIGAYPGAGSRIQRIDMDDIEAVEATAPGSGIAKLAHEIQENYSGHAGAPVGGMAPFNPAHGTGVAAESQVATDLIGPGNRVAGVQDRHSPTEYTNVQDFDNYYFLYTLTQNPPADFEVTSAIQAAKSIITTNIVSPFASGSSALPATAAAAVAAAAGTVTANSDATVRIKGYTDDDGVEANNVVLSQDRATAIQTSLVAAGVGRGRTYTKGLGQADPVASNATPAGQAQNRRVEIDVTQPDASSGPMTSAP